MKRTNCGLSDLSVKRKAKLSDFSVKRRAKLSKLSERKNTMCSRSEESRRIDAVMRNFKLKPYNEVSARLDAATKHTIAFLKIQHK